MIHTPGGDTRHPTALELQDYAESAAQCRRNVACTIVGVEQLDSKLAEYQWWDDVWRERQVAYRRAEAAEILGFPGVITR